VTAVIGVTATLKEDVDSVAQRPLGRFVRADLDYVEGVAEAGGAPVVLPPVVGSRAAESLLDGLDGLLLSGGSDLDPSYYGEEPVPELGVTIPERDAFEMVLLEHALRRGMPIFGICRGMQILNVALGGTLYQDLPSQMDHRVLLGHRQETPKWQPTHEVEVEGGSKVGQIMGVDELKVNSYHHQGIKDLARGLLVSAVSPDGVVEAVEFRDFSERWLVGVQWHAEAMRAAGLEHRNLFEAHVCAAERHALRHAAA
jgi:putative glutamine amidotransferase